MNPSFRQLSQLLLSAHKEGRVVTSGQLTKAGFSLEELQEAVRAGVAGIVCNGTCPSDYPVRSTAVEPDLYARIAAATHIPRAPPFYSRILKLCFWRDLETLEILPFAVRLNPANRVSRIVLTSQGDAPDVKSENIFRQEFVYRGDQEFQHCLRDAYDMNMGAKEGLFMSAPPWVHPAVELPLALRKP